MRDRDVDGLFDRARSLSTELQDTASTVKFAAGLTDGPATPTLVAVAQIAYVSLVKADECVTRARQRYTADRADQKRQIR